MRLRTVDAFTDRPFTGNPAAVLVLDEAPPDEWMAAVAREYLHHDLVLQRAQIAIGFGEWDQWWQADPELRGIIISGGERTEVAKDA